MRRRHRNAKRRTSTQAGGGLVDPRAAKSSSPSPVRRRNLRPVGKAVMVFGGCVVLFYVFQATDLFKGAFFPAYLQWNANTSAGVLNILGLDVTADGTLVRSQAFEIEIHRGCEAVEPSALYIAAVLAVPALFWKRLVGVLAGIALLMITNFLRIVSLFLVGVYWPAAFDVMHVDVWQAVFVLLVVVLWAVWVRWAKQDTGTGRHVQT